MQPRYVKVVQQMLGHGSATMTLDTYGHLFDDRLDEVADAMAATHNAPRGWRSSMPLLTTDLLLPKCFPRAPSP